MACNRLWHRLLLIPDKLNGMGLYDQIGQNVSGYVCNHGSLRVGNETLRPLGVAMGNAVSVTRV